MFESLASIVSSLGPLSGLFKGKTQHLPFAEAHQVAVEYAQQVFTILQRLYGQAAVMGGGSIAENIRRRLLAFGPGARWQWQASPQYRDLQQRIGLNVYQMFDLYYTYILQQYDITRTDEIQQVMIADLDYVVKGAIIDAGFNPQDFAEGLQIVQTNTGISISSPKATVNRAIEVGKWVAIIAAVYFGGTLIYKGVTK